MGVFSAAIITAVQNRVNTQGVNGTTMGLNQAMTYIGAVDVNGGPEAPVTLTGGNIQAGGTGLTNQQYQALYEMLF